jgi:hypothetical protein
MKISSLSMSIFILGLFPEKHNGSVETEAVFLAGGRRPEDACRRQGEPGLNVINPFFVIDAPAKLKFSGHSYIFK